MKFLIFVLASQSLKKSVICTNDIDKTKGQHDTNSFYKNDMYSLQGKQENSINSIKNKIDLLKIPG